MLIVVSNGLTEVLCARITVSGQQTNKRRSDLPEKCVLRLKIVYGPKGCTRVNMYCIFWASFGVCARELSQVIREWPKKCERVSILGFAGFSSLVMRFGARSCADTGVNLNAQVARSKARAPTVAKGKRRRRRRRRLQRNGRARFYFCKPFLRLKALRCD